MEQDVALRQQEAEAQQHILSSGFDDLYQLIKMEFSSQNTENIWISPSREQLATTLASRLNPLSPAESRKRKRLCEPRIIFP